MSEVKKMRVKGSGEIPCVTSLSDIRGGRGSLSTYSTAELQREFEKREGVTSFFVAPDEVLILSVTGADGVVTLKTQDGPALCNINID